MCLNVCPIKEAKKNWSFFLLFPTHFFVWPSFLSEKKQSVFWGYAQNLKNQGFAKVGFASFSGFYFFYLQIFNCIIVLCCQRDKRETAPRLIGEAQHDWWKKRNTIKGITSSNFLNSHVIGFDAILNRIILDRKCSLLICTQVNLSDWVKLFPVAGIGESSHSRIMERCKSIHLEGRELRLEGKLWQDAIGGLNLPIA